MEGSPEESLAWITEETSRSVISQVLCPPNLVAVIMKFRFLLAAAEDLQVERLCFHQNRQAVWTVSSRPGWA